MHLSVLEVYFTSRVSSPPFFFLSLRLSVVSHKQKEDRLSTLTLENEKAKLCVITSLEATQCLLGEWKEMQIFQAEAASCKWIANRVSRLCEYVHQKLLRHFRKEQAGNETAVLSEARGHWARIVK